MSGPTSKAFVALVVLLTVLVLAVTIALVPRLRGRRRYVAQAAGVLLSAVTATLCTAVVVNATQGWLVSWADVFGADEAVAPVATQTPSAAHTRTVEAAPVTWVQTATPLQRDPAHNPALRGTPLGQAAGGTWTRIAMPGTRSGVRRTALLWLPPSYAASPTRFYPVVVAFGGFPGTAEDISGPMQLGQQVMAAVRAKQLREPVVVVPEVFEHQRDTECVDATRGAKEQLETWISQDISEWITTNLRVVDAPQAWTTFGFSAGGYCASMLTLRHPERYGSAIALSATWLLDYDGEDLTATDDPRYNLLPLLGGRVRAHLYAYTGELDAVPARQLAQAQAAVRYPTTLTPVVRKGLGHSFSQWPQAVPAALVWLGKTSPWFRAG